MAKLRGVESGSGGWSFLNLHHSRLNQLRPELGTVSSRLPNDLKSGPCSALSGRTPASQITRKPKKVKPVSLPSEAARGS